MKKCFPALSLFVGLALMILCASASGDLASGPGRAPSEPLRLDPDYGALPLYFIPTGGQTDAEALFYARTSGTTLWVTKTGLIFDSARPTSPDLERRVSRLLFIGANSNAEVRAAEPSAYRVNDLTGNDPSAWRTDIPTSTAVIYGSVYRNIDLKVYGREGRIEYDWLVRPGGELREIRFRYQGVEGSEIERDGNILVRTGAGEFRHLRPTSFQVIGGRRVPVEAIFRKIGENEYGFSAKGYDPAYELVIDPVVLIYSTYFGGTYDDYGEAIALGPDKSVYIVGETYSKNLPTKNPFQAVTGGAMDAFVTKIAPNGKSLVYSTYLGGSDQDYVYDIAVDDNGQAVVAGHTGSGNFPLRYAYQENKHGRYEAFAAKIEAGGDSLAWSTYLGGSSDDFGRGVAVDANSLVYVTGYTLSKDFPTSPGAYQKAKAGWSEAFVTKLSLRGATSPSKKRGTE